MENMVNAVNRPKKRLFIGLILLSLLLASFSIYGIWRISFAGLADISVYLPMILGMILVSAFAVVFFGILRIIFAIWGLPSVPFFQKQAWTAIHMLFPIAVVLGKLADVEKERIERSFIEVSNQIIRQRRIQVEPDRLLVITPHCLQEESCPHKITRNPKNCKKCGRCQVGELLTLSEKYGFHFAVVTGGTLSRQLIKSMRPQAVLAIACERDLTSGIQDIYPLPVIGVLNERPCGPCNNTKVDVRRVEEAVQNFLKKEGGADERA